ncbi:MAG: hypothetical protein ACLUE8_13470 [Lachnospiraceae bacterium]
MCTGTPPSRVMQPPSTGKHISQGVIIPAQPDDAAAQGVQGPQQGTHVLLFRRGVKLTALVVRQPVGGFQCANAFFGQKVGQGVFRTSAPSRSAKAFSAR